jgi:hypothetical protein
MNLTKNMIEYNGPKVYQYSLALIRKIKHELYDLLEQTIS